METFKRRTESSEGRAGAEGEGLPVRAEVPGRLVVRGEEEEADNGLEESTEEQLDGEGAATGDEGERAAAMGGSHVAVARGDRAVVTGVAAWPGL